MSEENKNLFVKLPEDATEKHQREWQNVIDAWEEYGEPFVSKPVGLAKIQLQDAYCDGFWNYAKAMAICGGIGWGIAKLVKRFNKKKMKNIYGRND